MKRMKIVHVCLSGNWSGSEVVAAELANGLCTEHDIGIVFAKSKNLSQTFYKDRLHESVRFEEVDGQLNNQNIEKAIRAIFGGDPDIIHGHLGPACRAIPKICPNSIKLGHLHIRYYNTQHGELDGLVAIAPWQLKDIPSFYKGEVRLVPNFSQEWASAKTSFPPKDLRYMLSLDAEQKLVGSVGRLHSDKGIDILIESMHQLNNPNIHLILFGEGSQETALRELARGLPNIHFMGFRHDVTELVHDLDLYISASRSEPFGLATLEAMRAGVSVVATNTYGSRWLLENHPERLFDIENVAETAKIIAKFANRVRENPDYKLERFSRNTSLKLMEHVYEEVLQNASSGG